MLEEISDGKTYDINSMVKADSNGCNDCSTCCHGVGEMVELNPFDIYEITSNLDLSFDELLDNKIEFLLNNKIYLPHLKMQGELEACSFLSLDGRCTIHGSRPNICRLFPLGRVYLDDDFKYFLNDKACTKPKLGKIKLKKWIGISNYSQNKEFILEWYRLLKALSFRVKFIHDAQEIEDINKYLHDTFYRNFINDGDDFYSTFYKLLPIAKDRLGIL